MKIPNSPVPTDPHEAQRWEHTRLRRRLLEGNWTGDLQERYERHMGTIRAQAHGELDLSSNPFRVINRELSVLYNHPPIIRHDMESIDHVADFLGRRLKQSGLWAQMGWFQSRVLGCREYLMRVNVEGGALQFRPVSPDYVHATSQPDRPAMPDSIQELRLRNLRGEAVWCWDVLDIRDSENPIYKVYTAIQKGFGEDVTGEILGEEFSGAAYPYRRKDGRPILPYVLYHAQHSGDRLWDPYDGMEAVEGSLNLAVAWSFWFHCLRDASWPQRYAANLVPAGSNTSGGSEARRFEVVTDPSSLLILESGADSAADTGQPMVGQWSQAADIKKMQEAISEFSARLAEDAGISGASLQRSGGTAKSGYAISLSNEGKREAQRKYQGQFSEADSRLIMVAAILLNGSTGSNLPEGGYSLLYQQIPLSPQELKERRANVLELVESGLLSRVDAYRELNPGITESQAKKDLEKIDIGRRLSLLSQ